MVLVPFIKCPRVIGSAGSHVNREQGRAGSLSQRNAVLVTRAQRFVG